MKAFDIGYFFSREIRRFRGYLTKSHQKGDLEAGRIVRALGVLAIFLLVSFKSPFLKNDRPDPSSSDELGKTAGISSVAVPPLPRRPLRLAGSPDPIAISARSAAVLDSSSGAFLYEKDADFFLPPASLTKILTALVSLEKYPLDDVVTVPDVCLSLPGNQMGLVLGEKITVEGLLYGLLVQSSSDAACALSTYKNSDPDAFIEAMNAKAYSLGLNHIRMKNPIGLEDVDHYANARELAILARVAMDNEEFRKIVATTNKKVVSADGAFQHSILNTNELLGKVPGVTGVKTGYTDAAKGCLVLSLARADQEVIVVVLGSDDRFGEAYALADWAFKNHRWSN